jgi:hypothetical protein
VRKPTKQTTQDPQARRKSLAKKTKVGKKIAIKYDGDQVKKIITNAANISAGALRVAAAFIPGMNILNGVATATSLIGTFANLK